MQHLALWSPAPSRNVLPLASTTALSHDLFLIFDLPFAVPFGGLHLSHSEPFLHKLAHSYWDLIPHNSLSLAQSSFLSCGPHIQLPVQCLHPDIPQAPETYSVLANTPIFRTPPAASPPTFPNSENGTTLCPMGACGRWHQWLQFFTFPASPPLGFGCP